MTQEPLFGEAFVLGGFSQNKNIIINLFDTAQKVC